MGRSKRWRESPRPCCRSFPGPPADALHGERKRKMLKSAECWRSWEPWLWGQRCSSSVRFYGGAEADVPEVGRGGFPRSIADLFTVAPNHGHVPASTQVGYQEKQRFFCMSCGNYAQDQIRRLADRCARLRNDEDRSSAGTTALRRLRRGLHPKHDVPVSCAEPELPLSRREARAHSLAARPQQLPASAAPLPGLEALRARIKAKEELAKASVG